MESCVIPQSAPSTVRPALLGAFSHGIDDKQRLIIPARWRQALGNPASLVVLPNLDEGESSLLLMSEDVYAQRISWATSASLGDTEAMQFLADLGEMTENPLLDAHGRIRLADWQMEYAGISTAVRMVGMGVVGRIWNPERRGPDAITRIEKMPELARKFKV